MDISITHAFFKMEGQVYYFNDHDCVCLMSDKIVLQKGNVESTLFQDKLPLKSLVLLEREYVVFGGDSKMIFAFSLKTGEEVWRKESKRKIFKMLRLNLEEVLIVDSAGSVRAINWRTGENMRDLYGHFSSVSAACVVGPFIITADMDCHVRVVKASSPREIVCYLLGNSTPVRAIYSNDEDTIVCINSEKVVKFYSIRKGGAEIDVKFDLEQPIVSEYLKPKKKLKEEEKNE